MIRQAAPTNLGSGPGPTHYDEPRTHAGNTTALQRVRAPPSPKKQAVAGQGKTALLPYAGRPNDQSTTQKKRRVLEEGGGTKTRRGKNDRFQRRGEY